MHRPAGFSDYGDISIESQLVPVVQAGTVRTPANCYGETADGQIVGYSANYPTARSDSDSYDVAAATLAVGQNPDSGTYARRRLFFSFDTSGLDDAHDVDSMRISVHNVTIMPELCVDCHAAAHYTACAKAR